MLRGDVTRGVTRTIHGACTLTQRSPATQSRWTFWASNGRSGWGGSPGVACVGPPARWIGLSCESIRPGFVDAHRAALAGLSSFRMPRIPLRLGANLAAGPGVQAISFQDLSVKHAVHRRRCGKSTIWPAQAGTALTQCARAGVGTFLCAEICTKLCSAGDSGRSRQANYVPSLE